MSNRKLPNDVVLIIYHYVHRFRMRNLNHYYHSFVECQYERRFRRNEYETIDSNHTHTMIAIHICCRFYSKRYNFRDMTFGWERVYNKYGSRVGNLPKNYIRTK
jgi:hypothetical protein